MRPLPRKGYTLLELVIVIAVLIVLGAVIVPTLTSSYSNTRQKSAADLIRARVVEARAKAMERGVWYRLAINEDKTRIRLAPDGPDFSTLTPDNPPGFNSQVVEDKLDKVTAEVIADPNNPQQSSGNSSGGGGSAQQTTDGNVLSNGAVAKDGEWVTVMTVGPEGICKEFFTTVSVKESKFEPIYIQDRGLAGSAAIVKPPKNGGNK
jgi:Tfp pilus assembly protein FimT